MPHTVALFALGEAMQKMETDKTHIIAFDGLDALNDEDLWRVVSFAEAMVDRGKGKFYFCTYNRSRFLQMYR